MCVKLAQIPPFEKQLENKKTSAPIGAWKCNFPRQTNRPTNRPGHREVTLPIIGSHSKHCSSAQNCFPVFQGMRTFSILLSGEKRSPCLPFYRSIPSLLYPSPSIPLKLFPPLHVQPPNLNPPPPPSPRLSCVQSPLRLPRSLITKGMGLQNCQICSKQFLRIKNCSLQNFCFLKFIHVFNYEKR